MAICLDAKSSAMASRINGSTSQQKGQQSNTDVIAEVRHTKSAHASMVKHCVMTKETGNTP